MFFEGSNRIVSPELLAKIADVIDSAVLITRFGNLSQFDHKIIYVNPAFTRLTGYNQAELIGRSPDILCDPRTGLDKMQEFYNKCRNGQNFAVNIDSFKRQGSELKLQLEVRPIFDDAQGSSFHIIMCKPAVNEVAQPSPQKEEYTKPVTTVTPTIAMNEPKDPIFSQSYSLTEEEQRQELESANYEIKPKAEIASDEQIADYCKTQFLANMSHDLRTPLNAIIGFSEVIKDQLFGPIENPRYVSYAKDIFRSGQELLGTISEIMELSEINPETEALEEEKINIGEIVDSVLDVLAPKAFECDVKIIKSLDAKEVRLRGDRRKIKQAFAGVLGNAIRYSARSSKIEVSSGINEKGDFRLVVYAKSANITGGKSNLGSLLGTVTKKVESEYPEISLARKFVEAHHGKFNIFNSATSGTEITITLPASRLSIETENKRLFKVIS
jgi:PAS domain S-box-containing protein